MPKETFSTSDIALASYLMVRGFKLSDITLTSNRKAIFHFIDSPNRRAHVFKFLNRDTSVEPLAFLDNLKSLKGMLIQRQ